MSINVFNQSVLEDLILSAPPPRTNDDHDKRTIQEPIAETITSKTLVKEQMDKYNRDFERITNRARSKKSSNDEVESGLITQRMNALSSENALYMPEILSIIQHKERVAQRNRESLCNQWNTQVYDSIHQDISRKLEERDPRKVQQTKQRLFDQYLQYSNGRRLFLDTVIDSEYDPFTSRSHTLRYRSLSSRHDPVNALTANDDYERDLVRSGTQIREETPGYEGLGDLRHTRSRTASGDYNDTYRKSQIHPGQTERTRLPSLRSRSPQTQRSGLMTSRLGDYSAGGSRTDRTGGSQRRAHSVMGLHTQRQGSLTRRDTESIGTRRMDPTRSPRSPQAISTSRSARKNGQKTGEDIHGGVMGERFDVNPRKWAMIEGSVFDDRRRKIEMKRADPHVQKKFQDNVIFDNFDYPKGQDGWKIDGWKEGKRMVDDRVKDHIVGG
ncbi:hypothetical protein BLNAU_1129 [Blattamonas nauphoetae]|uniref:Uncharacterized protein n=1 Tax=Blattamonas nauphoetae TaxID=2049346 RepID=A0ABQ9YJX8_9EUKA|nr:hypothetical protein BLNAU_1129 [Blattamonas nauphoetae]